MHKLTVPAVAILAASAALAGCMAAGASGTRTSGTPVVRPAPLVVRTDKGPVRGIEAGGAREFLGIPYAAPPTGPLRWRPPQPASRWSGIRDAAKPGPACAQTGSVVTGEPVTSTAENCIYDGAPLTAGHNVVVVTINYRLGPFGFLALPSLDSESPGLASGDYGLMDQQAALRWVQRNARAFGGDPGNVTIFGESAGGASVCDNMASPTASGLFSHAIAESGCFLLSPAKQAAEQQGATFAAKLGCTAPATAAGCLRGKSAAALLAAAGGPLGGWGPVAGTPVLPLAPASAFAAGRYAHVPLLQGSNHDEGRFFVGFEFDVLGKPLTAARYPQVLAAQFGAGRAAQIQAVYPLSHYASPDLAYAAVFTDAVFSCPALDADLHASGSGVYGYEFADENAPNNFGIKFSFPLGAAHSTELQYVFGKIPDLDATPPFTTAQFALSAQMMGYWTRFAATGDPNGGGAPYWPRFNATRQQIQELVPGATAPQTGFAAEHHCAFWASAVA